MTEPTSETLAQALEAAGAPEAMIAAARDDYYHDFKSPLNGQAVCLEHVDDVFAAVGGTVRAVAEKLRSVLVDALGVLEPRCRDCGETLDGYSALDDDDSVSPDEGMVSLCAYCGCLSVFTGRGLEARPPTGAELALFARDRDVRRAVRAIRSPENPLRRRRRS